MPPGQVWGHLPLFETLGTLGPRQRAEKKPHCGPSGLFKDGCPREEVLPWEDAAPSRQRPAALLGPWGGVGRVVCSKAGC